MILVYQNIRKCFKITFPIAIYCMMNFIDLHIHIFY